MLNIIFNLEMLVKNNKSKYIKNYNNPISLCKFIWQIIYTILLYKSIYSLKI